MSGIFPDWIGTSYATSETIIQKEFVEVDSGGGHFVNRIKVTANILINNKKKKPIVKAKLL